jgi:hypothetical protein
MNKLPFILYGRDGDLVIYAYNDYIELIVVNKEDFYKFFSQLKIKFPTVRQIRRYGKKDFIFSLDTWDYLRECTENEFIKNIVQKYDTLLLLAYPPKKKPEFIT